MGARVRVHPLPVDPVSTSGQIMPIELLPGPSDFLTALVYIVVASAARASSLSFLSKCSEVAAATVFGRLLLAV